MTSKQYRVHKSKRLLKNRNPLPVGVRSLYLNDMKSCDLGLREHLLAWVFSTILEQHGFALKLAEGGIEKFDDELFLQLRKGSEESLS